MRAARILVVDDEPQLRRVMRAALTRQGYVIDDARTGEEALEAVRRQRYDLLLLDRNLPAMSGVDCCRAVRECSDAAIIMLTVRKAEQDRIEALDAGADDYVTKPFSMPELLARIRANLRRVPSSSHDGVTVVTFDAIQVDLDARHVYVEGKDVHVTPKQFEVLEYLIANANMAIQHARILQAVWGPDYGNESEYLHVIMNQLRKKIEPDPAHPRYIFTEPRFGYRLRVPGASL